MIFRIAVDDDPVQRFRDGKSHHLHELLGYSLDLDDKYCDGYSDLMSTGGAVEQPTKGKAFYSPLGGMVRKWLRCSA